MGCRMECTLKLEELKKEKLKDSKRSYDDQKMQK